MSRPRAILVNGPTASGKSALAVRLAAELGGLVVNADSMQVYRDLSIITARPSPAEMNIVPHALFGTVDGATNYSVTQWLGDVARKLDAAAAAGLLPIFAGGTGLYFKALTQGLSAIPPVPPSVRRTIRAEAEGLSAPQLHSRLAAVDPLAAARLRATDPQRILRALEVHAATGQSLVAFQATRSTPLLPVDSCAAVFLSPERNALRVKIDERFEGMMKAGALDEVAALAGRRLDPALPVMRAHGVPPLLRHLGGALTREEAVAIGKADTRRYVKRQETFARHQLPGFVFLDPQVAATHILTLC